MPPWRLAGYSRAVAVSVALDRIGAGLGDRLVDRVVHGYHGIESQAPEQRPKWCGGRHHEPELTPPRAEILREVVQQPDRGAVQVGDIGHVDREEILSFGVRRRHAQLPLDGWK